MHRFLGFKSPWAFGTLALDTVIGARKPTEFLLFGTGPRLLEFINKKRISSRNLVSGNYSSVLSLIRYRIPSGYGIK